MFLTGSEDGLMCAVNNACADIDDALEAVMNANVALSRIGFVGAQAQQLYALTNVQGLQLWDFGREEMLVNIEDMRAPCSQAVSSQMDYLIDCKYHAPTDELYLLAGGDAGQLAVFHVHPGQGPMAAATAYNAQGHTQVVRGFDWHVDSGRLWTGGEDCKVRHDHPTADQ